MCQGAQGGPGPRGGPAIVRPRHHASSARSHGRWGVAAPVGSWGGVRRSRTDVATSSIVSARGCARSPSPAAPGSLASMPPWSHYLGRVRCSQCTARSDDPSPAPECSRPPQAACQRTGVRHGLERTLHTACIAVARATPAPAQRIIHFMRSLMNRRSASPGSGRSEAMILMPHWSRTACATGFHCGENQ